MIASFRHKGLKRFWETGDSRGLQAKWLPRIRRQLDAMDVASRPSDLDLPGWRLHELKGKMKGRHSLTVTGNWRITFAFDGVDIVVIDLEDYH